MNFVLLFLQMRTRKNSKNDSFSKVFKSDLGSAAILIGCGIAGEKDGSRTIEIARKILIFPQAQ